MNIQEKYNCLKLEYLSAHGLDFLKSVKTSNPDHFEDFVGLYIDETRAMQPTRNHSFDLLTGYPMIV